MPVELLLSVPDLFDGFSRAPGSLSPESLWSLQTWPLLSLPLGMTDLSPSRGRLVAEEAGTASGLHGVQVDRVIFNWLYLLSQLTCPNPAPPTSSLPYIIGSLLSLLTPIQLYNCGLGHRLFFAWCQRLFSYQECVFKWPSPE